MRNTRTMTMLAALLSLGLALVLSTPALAHDPDDYRGDSRQIGYQNGYRDGFQHGRYDLSQRAGYNFRSEDYERGDTGYDSSMGSRGQFKQGYRDGYRAGYDDGFYSRRARFEVYVQPAFGDYRDRDGDGDYDRDDSYYDRRDSDYRSVAYNTGFQDGLDEGAKDRRTGHSFRPYEHAAWKDADHNLSTVRANKQDYKSRYREGYERGYQQGYGRY
jgi:hypothetical protein